MSPKAPLALGAVCCALALTGLSAIAGAAHARPDQLLWGDTHLHSSNSFDAYLNRNMSADPDTAYRYAKGLPVIHPYHRARVQIETPLDFLVVADHAEYLGVMRHIQERGIPRDGLGLWDTGRAWFVEWWLSGVIADDEGMAAFTSFLPVPMSVEEAAAQTPEQNIPNSELMTETVWNEAIRIADAHHDPGTFTTMIGWEFSSIPAGANLHRVVFTPDGADVASKFLPWSSVDSMYPEDLWTWLDQTSEETGARFVAIPHNSNISKGYMFTETTLRGEAYDAELAKRRAKWEPIVEITQIKGDSETHPSVSPNDPFADFETYPHYIQNDPPPYDPKPGDYVRSGLLLGLAMERELGVNPYRFGLIGSTDAHTGMASAEEPNFWGKLARDSIPENKPGDRGTGWGPTGWSMSASGLAAVWAEENSRDAIYDAFRRREVYATSGPRIAVRVFAGFGIDPGAANADDLAAVGYEKGVPMGGVTGRGPDGAALRILVHAAKDPKSANLDRVQVVKGWIDAEGATHERVFDVVWSGARTVDASGAVAAVGNTVDPDTATYTNDIGAVQLATVWEDPEFEPDQPAFYYVRALEIPTPRHSVWDALALELDPREIQGPWWIQERAYTSPIWYQP